MLRKILAPSLVVLVAACGAGSAPKTNVPPPTTASPSATSTTPPSAAPPAASADAQYEDLWKRFLDEYLRREPVEATSLGNHDHDGDWPDMSADAEKTELAWMDAVRADLEKLQPTQLSDENRLDAAILKNELAYIVWRETTLHPGETNPIRYVRVVSDGFDPLVTREFAPAADRAKSLAKRLRGIAPIVAAARARLSHPPRIYTETAIRQNKGLVALVDGGFPELLAQAPAQKDDVLAAAKEASKALHDLQGFLEKELLPKSDGDFRVGKENLQTILRYQLDADVDADDLVSRARQVLAQTQDEMAQTARELWPELMGNKPLPDTSTPAAKKALVKQVLAKLADDHPTNATIIADATKVLAQATDFVKKNELVTVPDQPVKVMEMPEYQRGVAVAYCDWAGPLETKGETHVTISPVPADWPASRAASFYREYDASMLVDLIVHEAMPGHYLQGVHASHFKGPRAIFGNGAFVEGWAVYAEWLMAKYGFGGAKVRMQRQKMLVRVATNAILDHEIHAGTMDEKAALDLMENEAFQEEGEAVGKWTRARVSHGQLSTYFYGFTELMKMREAAEKQQGFSERAYHDKLLSFGAPSLHQIRAAMGM